MNTQEKVKTEGLRDAVQALRDRARDTLRKERIQSLLNDLFYTEKELSQVGNYMKDYEKSLARSIYKLSKLDEADPDYEDKKKSLTETVECETKYLEKSKEAVEKSTERLNKAIAEINEDITKVENGEKPVSMERVDELVKNWLRK